MRLYRFLCLLSALITGNPKHTNVKVLHYEFGEDSVVLDSNTPDHCYVIYHMTTFKGVMKWQDEGKLSKQSVLFNRCEFIDCAPIPNNMFQIETYDRTN